MDSNRVMNVEKIDKQLESIKKRDIVETINDCFFEKVEDAGRLMYCRSTNLQRDGQRTRNILDEVEVEEQQRQAEEEEKKGKDISYEDYMAMFADHIEGKAKNERVPIASDDEEEKEKSQKPPSRKTPAKPVTPKKEEEKKEKDDGAEVNSTMG